jgi:hypothetical protein
MNCKNCSSPIDSNSEFCSKCGSKQDSQFTPTTEQQTKKRSKLKSLIGIVLIAAVVGVGFFLYQQRAQENLEATAEAEFDRRSIEVDNYFKEAVDVCVYMYKPSPEDLAEKGFRVSSDSLSIDGKGEKDNDGAVISDMACVFVELKMPDRVIGRIDSTSSLQGVLDDSWKVLDGNAEIFVKWSYHPNPGSSFSVQIKSVYQDKFDFETHYKLVEDSLDN